MFGDVSIEMFSFDSGDSQGRRHLKPFIALKRRDGLIAISLVSCLRMGALGIFCWFGKSKPTKLCTLVGSGIVLLLNYPKDQPRLVWLTGLPG